MAASASRSKKIPGFHPPTPTFRSPILVQPGDFPKADHHQAPYDALPNGDAFCRGCGSTVGLDGIVHHLWNCPVAAAEAAAGSTHFAPWDHGQEPPLTAP